MPLWLPLVQPCIYSTGVSSEADFAGSSVCLSHSFTCPSASILDPKLYAASGLRITLQPDTRLLGLRYFFCANLSSVSLCVRKAYVPFWGVITSSLLRAGQYRSFLAGLGLPAGLQVYGGLEEARVAVFLHQSVDFFLGQLKTGLLWMIHVLLGDGFGQVVKIHL